MSSSVSHLLCLLLALLASILLLSSVPGTSAQTLSCYPCVVAACATYYNGSAPTISIGYTSAVAAAVECETLNTDIVGFVTTAQNATCAASLATLACDVIATVNQTETNCSTSSIGVGTPFGNQTFFEQQCSAVVGCLGYTDQDEVIAGDACSSFPAFLGALVAQPAPSTVACAPCNITSCYGLSTIGVTDVTFWAGSLPGLNGSACAAQQAVAANLLANGNTAVPPAVVQATVCNPLAALTIADSQTACNVGEVDNIFNGVIFTAASANNVTWESYCQPSLSQVFDATIVSRLVAAGYCVSPSAGLTAYAQQYLLSAPSNGTSNSTASGGAGCYPCVVNACASYNNGIPPSLSIGATSAALAAAECTTLNTDIGGFIATSLNATCAANVAALACAVVTVTNQTDTTCNTSTIGVGTPLGNQTYFEQQCASAVGCLGYTYQDEVLAGGACSSFQAFLGAIVAQPAPSTVACAPCNITSCYGLSTIGVTDVTFWAGSLPGLNGSACAAQQAVAANLLANGNTAVPPAVVQATVCNPLAALTIADSQTACNVGEVDNIFNGVIFTAASANNVTWESYCQPSLSQVFDATIVSRLVAAGYCVSPSAGLTAYAQQYLLSAPNGTSPSSPSSSSTSSAAATSSSSSSSSGAAAAGTPSSSSSSAAASPASSSSTAATVANPTSSPTSSSSQAVVPPANPSSSSNVGGAASSSSAAAPAPSSSAVIVVASTGSGSISASGASSVRLIHAVYVVVASAAALLLLL